MKKHFFKLISVMLVFGLLLCSSCDKKPNNETNNDAVDTMLSESERNTTEDVKENTASESENASNVTDAQSQNTTVTETENDNNTAKSKNENDSDKSADSATAKADEVSFENKGLLLAVKKALGKEFITKQDILDIYYLAIVPIDGGAFGLSVGLSDYRDAYFAEIAKEAPNYVNLIPYVKEAEFSIESSKYLDTDLALFENIEIFEYYAFPVNDVTFIKNYPNLTYGYFSSNGITDVSGLSDYNPESLTELDFTGNSISDWSALNHIEDKVIVLYSAQDGKIIKLNEYNASSDKDSLLEIPEAPVVEETQEPEMSEEEAKKQAEALGQQIAESIDWGSLFE